MLDKRTFWYLSIFLFFYHSANTVISTFLPVYYQEKQISGTQIGWLMAVGPFTSLISQPFWGYMSDKYKTIKKILLICLAGIIVSSIIFLQMNSFWMIFLFAAIFFTFFTPAGALGDSLAINSAPMIGTSFGTIRMWGSIGFAVMSLLGGVILARIGIANLLYPFLLFALLAFAITWKVNDTSAPSEPINLKRAVQVLIRPRFLIFTFFIMFVSITHRTNDIFSGIYIKQLGGDESLIGMSWFVGVALEAIVYMLSPIWLKFLSEINYMVLAAGLYGVRWLLFAFASSPTEIIILQALHGITFGIFYLCSFQYATNLFPKEFRATGQLFFITAFFGLSGIIGSVGGGIILDRFTGNALYELLSYLSFAGCIGLVGYKLIFSKKTQLI